MKQIIPWVALLSIFLSGAVVADEGQGGFLRKTNLRTGQTSTVTVQPVAPGGPPLVITPAKPALAPNAAGEGQYTPEQVAEYEKVFGQRPPARLDALSHTPPQVAR